MNGQKVEQSISGDLGGGKQNEFLGDTLLSQYKRCNQINDQQLRKAKNIKDLVSINVAAIDKQLYVSGGSKRAHRQNAHTSGGVRQTHSQQPSYNLAFDPVVFRQRVPCMGNRNFLVNQAILMNSTEASLGTNGIHTHPTQSHSKSKSKSQSQSRRNMRHTHSQHYKRTNQPLPNPNHRPNLQNQQDQDLNQEQERALELVQMGHGSQLDPVKNLQSLFQKKQNKERKPCKNFIQEKYRRLRHRGDLKNGVQEQERVLSEEKFAFSPEDPFANSNLGLSTHFQSDLYGSPHSPPAPTSAQLVSPDHQALLQHEQQQTAQLKAMRAERVAGTAPAQSEKRSSSYNTHQIISLNRDIASAQHIVTAPKQTTDLNETHKRIRDKLNEMKNLFEEDNEKILMHKNQQAKGGRGRLNGLLNQAGGNDPENWNDAHGHKIMYEEAMDRRRNQLKRMQNDKQAELAGGTLSDARAQGFNEDELKQFLTDRISALREKTFGKDRELDGLNDPRRFKFKASTIANVLPRGVATEHSKLQQNYKTRYSTTGANFLQKRGSAGQQRTFTRQESQLRHSGQRKSTEFKRQRVEQLSHREQAISNKAPSSFPSQTDLEHPFDAASARTSSRSKKSDQDHQESAYVESEHLVVINQQECQVKEESECEQMEGVSEKKEKEGECMGMSDDEIKGALLLLPLQTNNEQVPEDELSVTRDRLIDQIRQKQREQQSLSPSQLSLQPTNPDKSPVSNTPTQPRFNLTIPPAQQTPANPQNQMTNQPPREQPLPPTKDQNLNISIKSKQQAKNQLADTLEVKDNETSLKQQKSEQKKLSELVQEQVQSLESEQFLSEIEDQLQANGLAQPTDTQQLLDLQSQQVLNQRKNLLMNLNMQEIEQQFDAPKVGAQLAFFSPRRFKRYPNFAIFFRDRDASSSNTQFVDKNTVSLNSDFLKFLIDKRHIQTAVAQNSPIIPTNNLKSNPQTQSISNMITPNPQVKESKTRMKEVKLPKVPSDVVQWNEYLKRKKFDPFEQVLLVKGIDNQILTSYRTLKGENNTVTDTFKIVHKKFAPPKSSNAFFKQMILHQIDKIPYQTNNLQCNVPSQSTADLNPADPDFLDQPSTPVVLPEQTRQAQVFSQQIPTAVPSPVNRSDCIFDLQQHQPQQSMHSTQVQIQLKPKVSLAAATTVRGKKENLDLVGVTVAQDKTQPMLDSSPVQLDMRSRHTTEHNQQSLSKKINIGIPFGGPVSSPNAENQPKIQTKQSQRRIISVPKPIVPPGRFLQRQSTSNQMNSPDAILPHAKLGTGIQGRSPLTKQLVTNGEQIQTSEQSKEKKVTGDKKALVQKQNINQFAMQRPSQSSVLNPLMSTSVYRERKEADESFEAKPSDRIQTVQSPTSPATQISKVKTRNLGEINKAVSTRARDDVSPTSTVVNKRAEPVLSNTAQIGSPLKNANGNVHLLSEQEYVSPQPQQDYLDLTANATFLGTQMNSTLKGNNAFFEIPHKLDPKPLKAKQSSISPSPQDKFALDGILEGVSTRGSLKRPRTKHSEQALGLRNTLHDPKSIFQMKVSVLKSNVRQTDNVSEREKMGETPPMTVTNSVHQGDKKQPLPEKKQEQTSELVKEPSNLQTMKQLAEHSVISSKSKSKSKPEQVVPTVQTTQDTPKTHTAVLWQNSVQFMKRVANKSPDHKQVLSSKQQGQQTKFDKAEDGNQSLKVPLSLVKTVEDSFSFSNLLATGNQPQSKAKMSLLANEIYAHDRKLISNHQLGNKLGANVLHLAKFHQLKSTTGVERKDYERKVVQHIVDSEQMHADLCLQASATEHTHNHIEAQGVQAGSEQTQGASKQGGVRQSAVIDLSIAGNLHSSHQQQMQQIESAGYQQVLVSGGGQGQQTRKGTELIRRSTDYTDKERHQLVANTQNHLSGTLGDDKHQPTSSVHHQPHPHPPDKDTLTSPHQIYTETIHSHPKQPN